uniref:Uncharacterized protein n=1 Tax=Opuntia streptacantha TaxID=393608 RepID=A0A7C9DR33_OPUST
MSHRTSLEVVPLDTTLESFSDGSARHIHKVTFLEQILKLKLLGWGKTIHRKKPKLLKMTQGDYTRLVQVPNLGLIKLTIPDPLITNLDSIIPICGISLHLGYNVSFLKTYHSDRNYQPILLKVGHHS